VASAARWRSNWRKAVGLALVDQSNAVHEIAKAVNEITANPVAFRYSGDVSNEDFRRKVYHQNDREMRPSEYLRASGMPEAALAQVKAMTPMGYKLA